MTRDLRYAPALRFASATTLVIVLGLIFARSAQAFTPEYLVRLRVACENGLKDAPPDFKKDVCGCYVRRAQEKFPDPQPRVSDGARQDVQRVLTDCFAEAIARRDPSVNSRRGWPTGYRSNFLAACEKGATAKNGVSTETAKAYCECSVRETERRFPDSLSAEKYSRHLLADAPTAKDQEAYEEVLRACNGEISGESEEVASVEYQIIRNMRKGVTRANAARRVLRGFSGYYLMLTEARKQAGAPKQNAEVERTKGLIAEAGRLYVEACSKCANTSACERDRIDALLPNSEDKLSPCGEMKAPGEEPAPPMSREEREALEKDAAPYVASALARTTPSSSSPVGLPRGGRGAVLLGSRRLPSLVGGGPVGSHADRSGRHSHGPESSLRNQPVYGRPRDAELLGDLADGQEAGRTEGPLCLKRD